MNHLQPQVFQCTVTEKQAISEYVYRVLLTPETHTLTQHYAAGQYLYLCANKHWLPYSIANLPGQNHFELHIRNTKTSVLHAIELSAQVDVECPYGNIQITGDQQTPLLLIAEHTGFSQIKSILETLAATANQQPILFLWLNKTQQGFYMSELPYQWQTALPNLTYHPVLTDPSEHWLSETQLLKYIDLSAFMPMEQLKVILCCSQKTTYETVKTLLQYSIVKENMLSDVFDYMPREAHHKRAS